MSHTYPYPLAATGSSLRSLPPSLNFEKPQIYDFSRQKLSTYPCVPGRLYSDERQESFYNIRVYLFATENHSPARFASQPHPNSACDLKHSLSLTTPSFSPSPPPRPLTTIIARFRYQVECFQTLSQQQLYPKKKLCTKFRSNSFSDF